MGVLALILLGQAAFASDGSVIWDTGLCRVRLIAYSDRIVRVTITPSTDFKDRPSLDVIANPESTSVTATNDLFETASVRVALDRKSGRLRFMDWKGRLLLSEATIAREFKPINLTDGESSFTAGERFQMPGRQAFYGLGSHQMDTLDLRGHDVDIEQRNMFAGIPFFVSTAGYGILWDNASHTNFNFGDATQIMPASAMFDRNRQPGGLSATYYSDIQFGNVERTGKEGPIDFEWKDKLKFSARWEGFVKTGPAGTYRFSTVSDDGARLWVNRKQIVNDWQDQPPTRQEGSINLPANKLIPIRLDYYQNLGGAQIQLTYSPPTVAKEIDITSEVADQIDYYFVAGPKLEDVEAGYRKLTGDAPLFGKWAYGFWQCKERYKSSDELLSIAEGYRSRKIPIDDIVQDWFYWDPFQWGSHKMDPRRYPDPKALLDTLHDKYHLHAMISVWAKFAPGSDNYNELNSKGLLYPAGVNFGDGTQFYDAFSKEGRDVYWRQIKDELFSLGWDAWWLDATEPEIDAKKWHDAQTAMGPAMRVLNAYPLMTTTAVYQGQRAATDEKRVFILTRSAFAGQQRNAAATWSGDIGASWDVFRKQVASGLNFTSAGIPYWCTDIGAFFSKPNTDPAYRELFTRWFEWGAFCPIFRVHGTGTDKELWRFGPEIQDILVKYDNLRYRLMPYIYSLAWQVTHNRSTIMRPVAMDFQEDSGTWNLNDQLMFGPALMVSPVVKEAGKSRSVYLPRKTIWYDFWTGAAAEGGRTIYAEAPLSKLPINVRAGSILPLGPFEQYTSEKPADPIELRVYPGANGSFELYEDAGDGYAYGRGERSSIPFKWNDARRELTIGARQGSFPGMLTNRSFRIVVVRPGHGAGIDPEPRADRDVQYDGSSIKVKL